MSAHVGADGSGAATPVVHVVLRPLATPMPLGFLGQAVASWAFACLQLSWLSTGETHTVALGVLVFTVPLQAVAAVLGFLGRDPVAATGTGLLAGGWAVVAAASLMAPSGAMSPGLGVLAVGIAATLLLPTIAALSRLAAAAVFVLSAARFAVLGVAEIPRSQSWLHVDGWVGLVLSATSVYAAAAFELEAATGRVWLPVGRTGSRPDDPLGEPGVRPSL